MAISTDISNLRRDDVIVQNTVVPNQYERMILHMKCTVRMFLTCELEYRSKSVTRAYPEATALPFKL